MLDSLKIRTPDLVRQCRCSPSWKICGRVALGPDIRSRKKRKDQWSYKNTCAVSSAVDPDPNCIRIQQLCEAGSVTDSQIQKEKKKLEW